MFYTFLKYTTKKVHNTGMQLFLLTFKSAIHFWVIWPVQAVFNIYLKRKVFYNVDDVLDLSHIYYINIIKQYVIKTKKVYSIWSGSHLLN